jgi:hypothetical protein
MQLVLDRLVGDSLVVKQLLISGRYYGYAMSVGDPSESTITAEKGPVRGSEKMVSNTPGDVSLPLLGGEALVVISNGLLLGICAS